MTITWTQSGQLEPIVVRTSESDLAAAVDALGRDCRDALWPTSTVADAGFNLLLVHLDETIATRPVLDSLLIKDDGLHM